MPLATAQQYIPAFRKSYRVEHVSGGGAYFFSEAGQLTLQPGAAEAVASLIDGERSADDIAGLLAGHLRPEDVHYALALMERNRLVYDSSVDRNADLRLWNCIGADLDRVKENLQHASVRVRATPDLEAQQLVEALERLSINVTDDGEFTVVLASDYLHEDLADLNREALESGRPWMLVKPVGLAHWFGPIFRTGVTACWECLAHRIRSGRALQSYFDNCDTSTPLARSDWPSKLDLLRAAPLVALHAAKQVALGENPQLDGRSATLDPFTLVTTTHLVTKRPHCKECGEPAIGTEPVRPRLENRPTRESIDNGHRTISAAETFARHQHHVSAVSGLVTELTPIRAASDSSIKLWLCRA